MFGAQAGRADGILGLVPELGRQHAEALGRQRAADQVEVGRIGQEQGGALVVARLQVLGTGLDCREFRVRASRCRLGFDHAHVVEVPSHRARGAQLALAKQDAHFRRGAVDVVGQAFHHDGHPVRRKAFIDNVFEIDRFSGEPGALLDGTVQRVLGHGDLARLLDQQPQARVGSRVGPAARRNHDVLGQSAEEATLGVCSQFLAFCFPLRAHARIPWFFAALQRARSDRGGWTMRAL